MHAEDPVIFLVAKHLLWPSTNMPSQFALFPLGLNVAWRGATQSRSLEALNKIDDEISVELIDLRSIVPWDAAAIGRRIRAQPRRLFVKRTRKIAASVR